MLTGCGGGGGGGGPGAGIITTPVPPSPTTIPTTLSGTPSFSSAEYRANYGLGSINAAAAWNRGGDGNGISVAVIDNGVDPTGELAGRVSAQTVDLDLSRNAPSGSTGLHGTEFSSIIAANYNEFGTVGVAYRSTIIGVRADSADGGFANARIAQGLDYATTHGARVINLSLSGGPVSPDIESALQRATDAGVVVVFAAGNAAGADPQNPGAAAGDPRYSGLVLAVGSIDSANVMSPTSNRAGSSKAGYLVAPGVGITVDCQLSGCATVSGTSFAAPHVSGAVALLLQMFPRLSSRDAVAILFATATDLGEIGTDTEFGRGKINLTNAIAPVGAVATLAASGQSVTLTPASPGTAMSLALGDAVSRSAGLQTIAQDSFLRPFQIDLVDPLKRSGHSGLWSDVSPRPQQSALDLTVAPGLNLTLVTALAPSDDAGLARDRQELTPTDLFLGRGDQRQVSAVLQTGPLTFSAAIGSGAWGAGAWPETVFGGASNPFAQLADSGSRVQAEAHWGNWSLAGTSGQTDHLDPARLSRSEGSRLTQTSLRYKGAASDWTLRFGSILEPWGPLGSNLDPRSSYAMPSRTGFVSVGLVQSHGAIDVSAQASIGRSRAMGPLLELDAVSSAWRMGVNRACGRSDCLAWYLDLSQPLRIETGRMSASVLGLNADGDILALGISSLGLSPSGRQIDFRAGLGRSISGLGYVNLEAGLSRDFGHVRAADLVSGVRVSLHNRF
jgi:subtilisin family serine protease